MKACGVLVVSLLTAARPAAAQPVPRVRALDAIAGTALARGSRESPRFQALLDQLEASDVIVHVVAAPDLPSGLMGTMRFVAQVGDARYVRIDLAAVAAPDVRVATLAHELQHACEVAESDAGSQDAVRRLYRRIGDAVPGARDAFETDGARRAAAAVLGELRAGRRSTRTTEY